MTSSFSAGLTSDYLCTPNVRGWSEVKTVDIRQNDDVIYEQLEAGYLPNIPIH